jgi:D-aminoacyl-tRNA deacylase
MLAIVVSRADSASEHIGEQLLTSAAWTEHEDPTTPEADGGGTYYRLTDGDEPVELRTFEELHIHAEGLAEPFDGPELLFVVSRHAGETGPLLTAHPTGNPGPAEFGGEPAAFARAAPNAKAALLAAFDEQAPDGYEVGLECTHHGPTDLDVPALFVELGSEQEQWADEAGARAVAAAVLACRTATPDRKRQLVGFGGGHYVPRFERIVRETDWAVGHVVADWALAEMDRTDATLRRVFERSAAEYALVDGDAPRVCERIEALGYRVVSETWLRESVGVPVDTVETLEDAVGPIDDGLRLGDPARGYTGASEVIDLPAELTAAAADADAAATRAALTGVVLAFETEEGGTRPAGQAALPAGTGTEAVVTALAGVLEAHYDEVVVTDGRVVASREAFNPARASELGVPEGPKFGQLAAGDPVEVDGRTVSPDAVHEREERTFLVSTS